VSYFVGLSAGDTQKKPLQAAAETVGNVAVPVVGGQQQQQQQLCVKPFSGYTSLSGRHGTDRLTSLTTQYPRGQLSCQLSNGRQRYTTTLPRNPRLVS